MTPEEAAIDLAARGAEAVAGVLEGFAGTAAEMQTPVLLERGGDPLEHLPRPTLVSVAAYADGVVGGYMLATSAAGAQHLAGEVLGEGAAGEAGGFSEVAMSAVAEAANQMLAAAAAATGAALAQPLRIEEPDTRLTAEPGDPIGHHPTAHVASVAFELHGEPARIVQVIPRSFVLRASTDAGSPDGLLDDESQHPVEWLRDARLRLSADLGRARLSVDEAVALGDGAVVTLDRHVDDPIDLLVNGAPFARGRLLLLDDGDWAVRIEQLDGA